jgi:hypothetical protein
MRGNDRIGSKRDPRGTLDHALERARLPLDSRHLDRAARPVAGQRRLTSTQATHAVEVPLNCF